MTEAHSPEPPAQGEATPEIEAVEAPAPEPWTPAKVVEWNAYYDIYVAIGVLLLCFITSANKITQPSVWSHLQAGRELSSTFAPTADGMSYSQPGTRWVHISWLPDLVHYQIYQLVAGTAKVDPMSELSTTTPEVVQAKRDQAEATEQRGVIGPIALDALLRALTVLVLLRLRHKGPGLWWAAVCCSIAFAVAVKPFIQSAGPNPIGFGVMLGGLASAAHVSSESWGQLLLAIELLWLFRAHVQGRPRALYAMIPLFLIWANVDDSFLIGLLILAASVAGAAIVAGPRPIADVATPRPTTKQALIVLAASAAACLVNPSFHGAYVATVGDLFPALGWDPSLATPNRLSYFGPTLRTAPAAREFQAFFLAVVGLGYATFVLNRRRFSTSRLLVYTVAALLWLTAERFRSSFSVVWAAVVALNGQEWYHDLFGTEGRLGRGWASWSIGGRALTIALIFALILKAVTGYGLKDGEEPFGFSFNPDDFAFEAADVVRDAPIEGAILNTWPTEGDALDWRASPKRKSFIDSRKHLYTAETFKTYDDVRRAIRDEDAEKWRPVLDKYGVSAIMLDVNYSRRTYQALLNSRNWILFHDDGQHVVFGRADASAADVAYFKSRKLEVDNLVYKNPTPLPSSSKLPTATTKLDILYPERTKARAQSHTSSAARWLRPSDIDPTLPYIPDPGRCMLAIREARIALAQRPDDTLAYRVLATAYRYLILQESALIAGVEPAAENIATIGRVVPRYDVLGNRYRQYVTALNFAIITAPPREGMSPDDKQQLSVVDGELFDAYLSQGVGDLARDRLQELIDLSDPETTTPDQYAALTRKLTDLNAAMQQIEAQLSAMGIESQAGPLQKAGFARQQGAVGMATQLLEEAIQVGINAAAVKPLLLDLYCQVGQPDKAIDLWTANNTADPVLGDGPGTAALRQGRVFLLLGNYTSAVRIWSSEAIPAVKIQRAVRAPQATRTLMEGDPMATTRTFLELPEEVNKEAAWEYELGMACLEAGQPVDVTAEHLTNALKLVPDLTVRPVIAYYLTKLGRTVPADPAAAKPTAAALPVPLPGATVIPPILTPK